MIGQKRRFLANNSIGSSELKYKWNFRFIKLNRKSNAKKLNYIGFFLLYFALSVIRIYLIIYIPVFLLNILSIDRGQLAFVQIFVYTVMFSGPLLGFLFDKYSKNKKMIIFSSSILFLASFLLSVFGVNNIGIFGLFLAINLLSHEIVKVGVSKMIIDHSTNESVKDSSLASINISSNIGSFIPSVVFLFTVSSIFDINQWNNFFLVGFLCSLPIIISTIILRETGSTISRTANTEIIVKEDTIYNKKNSLNLFLLFLSYLLIWSDKLYQFPFSSWILDKFGEEGFNIYSLLYIALVLLNIGGWIIGQRISAREDRKINRTINKKCLNSNIEELNHEKTLYDIKVSNRRKIIGITVGLYVVLTFLMVVSDFIFLMIIQGLIQIVAGVMMLNYTSLMMTMANNGKYKTFTFQCLKIAYAFSCVIFLPLGTFFSAFIQIEVIIIIVGFLAILSLLPIILLRIAK